MSTFGQHTREMHVNSVLKFNKTHLIYLVLNLLIISGIKVKT